LGREDPDYLAIDVIDRRRCEKKGADLPAVSADAADAAGAFHRVTWRVVLRRNTHSLLAGLQSRFRGCVLGLHVNHAKLPLRDFTVCGHDPYKSDGPARRGDVRVISLRHHHAVTFAVN